MKPYTKVYITLLVVAGLSLVAYAALAQDTTPVPSFELAPTAGPVLSGVGVTINPAQLSQNENVRVTVEAYDVSGVETILADVKNSGGALIAAITLYDDGVHGDGLAGDSVFSNTWNVGSTVDGSYNLDIQMSDRLSNPSTVSNAISMVIGPGVCASDSECVDADTGDICCVGTGLCAFNGCLNASDCDDFDNSTTDTCDTGSCPSVCQNTLITDCINNDNYCPSGCVIATDNDCSDITFPTVSITDPANDGFSITTDTYVVVANAIDVDTGISKVEFYVDNEASPRDTQLFDSPADSGNYNWVFDASSLANGSHTLVAVAYDNVSLSTTVTRSVMINITSAAPFNVSVTAPVSGASFASTDNIQFTIHAEDDVAVQDVYLYSVTGGQFFFSSVPSTPVVDLSTAVLAGSIARVPEAIRKYVDAPAGFRLPFIPTARAAEQNQNCITSSTTVTRDIYASAIDGDGQATLSGTIQISVVTTSVSCTNINMGGAVGGA